MVADAVPKDVEVAIIGSGVVGLFTAFHLLNRSNLKVAVFDRGPLGGVASPRAGGLLRHHYSHPIMVEMAMRGREFYERFEQETGHSAGYVQNGYVLAAGPEHAEWLAENVEMVQGTGVDTALISADTAAEVIPWLDLSSWSGAIAFDRSAAYVQPHDVMRGLVSAVSKRGASLHPGSEIVQIEATAGQVTGVWTDAGDRIGASVVVNAAGAWAAKVGEMASLTLPVSVRRLLQIQEIRATHRVRHDAPSFSSDLLDLYARPNHGNRLLIGSREYFEGDTDPSDVYLHHSREQINEARERIGPVLKDRHPTGVYQAWAGVDGDTPDFQPIIGRVPDTNGLLLGVGLSAHGFKLGPVIGELIADLITYGSYRVMNAESLGLERFENGQLFPMGYKQMGA